MIKILFDHTIFLHQKNGGISKYINKINENLPAFKIVSKIFSPITINDNLKKNQNSNIFYLKFKKIPRFSTKIFYLINNLASIIYIFFFKPDIIHFSYYNNNLLKYIKIPYVVTVYDLISEKMNFKKTMFEKGDLIKNAKHILCISNQTKRDLIRYYKINKKKITVIYLGVDQHKYLKKNKKKYILFVGSRGRYKNFTNFLKAFSKSKYLLKNYKVLCFGGEKFSNEEISMFNKFKIEKKIFFKSDDDLNLKKTYTDASLFINPSLLEGFGLTNLEAMRCGCPVICSNIPVFKEVLGNSVEYFNPKNIEDIRNKLERILKSEKKKLILIKKGFKKVEEYSWRKCAYKTSEIYKKIIY